MKPGKILTFVVVFVIAINVVIIASMFGSAPKPPPMPNPNGFDDFLRAGAAMHGGGVRYTNQTREEMNELVAGNSNALKFVHLGLTHESLVPNDYSTAYANRMLGEVLTLKNVIFLFLMEGRAAELNGRTNDAVKVYLDGLAYADAMGRGGAMGHKLSALSCEKTILSQLDVLRPYLDVSECASIVSALEKLDAQRDSVQTTVEREKDFRRKTGGFRGQIVSILVIGSQRAADQKVVEKINANTLHSRQEMVSFAARAYELDKGKLPTNIAELTPAYLKSIPKDPMTGVDLTYP